MALDKVIDSAELDAKLTAVADAIRTKGGTTEQLNFPDGFVSAVEGIQAGGGDDVLRSIVERTITNLDTDVYEEVGRCAFYGCSKLTTVKLKNTTLLNQYSFRECSALVSVDLPDVTHMKSDVFTDCGLLSAVNVPKLEDIYSGVFLRCKSLKYLDFPATFLNFSGGQSLRECTNLTSVFIRGNHVTRLSNTNVFTGSRYASGGLGGYIFVPSAFIESYKVATNWASLYESGSLFFEPLEDYTLDGTTTGEINWDKVNALFEGVSV